MHTFSGTDIREFGIEMHFLSSSTLLKNKVLFDQ